MKQTVSALITTTEKNKKGLEKLIACLCRESVKMEKVVIIYDGVLRPEKRAFEDCPLSISWVDNSKSLPLTYLENQAIKFAREDFILLLNDDVILEKNFVEKLLRVMNQDESIGMVCGKILRMDKATIDTAGQLLRNNRTPLERGYGQKDSGQFEKPEYVFGSCGAAVLYRRRMLEDCAISEFEYFDNEYNMFYEDMDLSWRAANLKWKAYYEPAAIAYHMRGATSKEKKPLFSFIRAYNFAWLRSELKAEVIRNRYMTIIKNDSMRGFLRNLVPILIYDFKVFFYCLIFEPRVIINNFRNIPSITKAFRKRKIIRKKMKEKK